MPSTSQSSRAVAAALRFEQDAGELAAVDQQSFGHLKRAASRSGAGRQRVGERQRRDKAELRGARRRAAGPQQQRAVEIARRREPGAAAPAAPGGLLAGPDERAGRRAAAGQALGLVIGAADRLVADAADSRRQGRRGALIAANSDAAAASAPPTIGSGSRMKNIVSTR